MRTTDALTRLAPGDPGWPDDVAAAPVPPKELWARGDLAGLDARPRVAVVGSRAPTPYGEAQAARFAGRLAAAGVCVVSGLARGVDSAAHVAALDAGGASIAVLGCGVDRPWPAGATARRMVQEGLVLSEHPPGTPPRRHHFPLRNRLIAALSGAVLVIEAAHRSGSLITARWSADLGRTVLAVPGRVDHPMSRGCHRLIRDGALMAESPEDVLAELGVDPASAPAADPLSRGAGGAEGPLLAALRGETLSADELATRTERPVGDVLAELCQRELAGAVVRAPGGLWRLPL